MIRSHNDDDNSDSHVSKALLEGEEKHDVIGSLPPYRSKQRRRIGSKGLAAGLAALTLLFGLLTLCFFWHLTTHKARSHRSDVLEMHQSSETTTGILNVEGDSETLDPGVDEKVFAGWKNCGSSVEEARAKGCFFDVMLHSWVHEDCFDKELMDDYLTKVPYHWYRDSKFEEEITVEEMRRGEHGSAAVKLEEHGTHCAYVLEKNLRAVMNGQCVARSIFSVKHAVHCIGLLVDPSTIPGVYTEVVVEYDQCGIPHFD